MTSKNSTENTDPDESTTAPETPVGPKAATDPDESKEGTDEGTGREAAKYRRRLRDTETERDTLRGQVEAFQRAEVERIASKNLVKPAGLWAAGVELANLIGEDGTVDGEKVTTAAKQASEQLGLEATLPNHVPLEGTIPPPPSYSGSFEDALTI